MKEGGLAYYPDGGANGVNSKHQQTSGQSQVSPQVLGALGQSAVIREPSMKDSLRPAEWESLLGEPEAGAVEADGLSGTQVPAV